MTTYRCGICKQIFEFEDYNAHLLVCKKEESKVNELEEYKKLVLAEALRAKDAEGWCEDEFDAAMRRLNIVVDGPKEALIKKFDAAEEGDVVRISGYVFTAVKNRRGWTTMGWRPEDFNDAIDGTALYEWFKSRPGGYDVSEGKLLWGKNWGTPKKA